MGYFEIIAAVLGIAAKLLERGRQTGELTPEQDAELTGKALVIFTKGSEAPPPPPDGI